MLYIEKEFQLLGDINYNFRLQSVAAVILFSSIEVKRIIPVKIGAT